MSLPTYAKLLSQPIELRIGQRGRARHQPQARSFFQLFQDRTGLGWRAVPDVAPQAVDYHRAQREASAAARVRRASFCRAMRRHWKRCSCLPSLWLSCVRSGTAASGKATNGLAKEFGNPSAASVRWLCAFIRSELHSSLCAISFKDARVGSGDLGRKWLNGRHRRHRCYRQSLRLHRRQPRR